MKLTDAILRRLLLKDADTAIDLTEIGGIFYFETQGNGT